MKMKKKKKKIPILMMNFSPSPSNINYMWNFGSLIIIMFMAQIMSGVFISFHYNSMMEYSFFSTIHINREVYMGWLIRFIHINGASMIFMLLYLHIIKNIINSSWKFKLVWISGILIILLSMMVAFMGYVLPWGQMSFWAATVITNLLSAIPYVGNMMVEWIWGGFSVSYPTLMRFFSLHFMLPFMIFFIAMVHILFLHINGSSNSISSPLNLDKISFSPYFMVKDLLGFFFFFFLFLFILFSTPYYSVDSENFMESNPMITPIHIKPEWYFLFAYAILRSIPNKVGGVVALFSSVMIFMVKIFQSSYNKLKFNYFKKFNNLFLLHIFIILTFLGSNSIDYPYEMMSFFYMIMYFCLIMIM